ncbi:lymphocyte antigen 6D-like [Cottoperca gobio]|uniref:Lymphocyte antigen 6D-like n=1 Tax=Cottoperca gobio TaxID=56716 RepID=A0A6J2R087_COTGO|nr:lymphocyte antigen 6D-like [Cottoperca gobio]
MKVQLLTLLLLLCSTQVLTLRCYTCGGIWNCNAQTECPASAQYCKAVWLGEQFDRTCEEYCVEDEYTYCCQEDLCGPEINPQR